MPEEEQGWQTMLGTDQDGNPGLRLEATEGDRVVFHRDMSVEDAAGLARLLANALRETGKRADRGELGEGAVRKGAH